MRGKIRLIGFAIALALSTWLFLAYQRRLLTHACLNAGGLPYFGNEREGRFARYAGCFDLRKRRPMAQPPSAAWGTLPGPVCVHTDQTRCHPADGRRYQPTATDTGDAPTLPLHAYP